MKRIVFLIAILSTYSLVYSQYPSQGNRQQPAAAPVPAGDGKLTGIVMDSTDKKPVEFATIALNDPVTNKPVDGTVCDQKGKFSLTRIAYGKYKVLISFIGFESQTFDVEFSEKNKHVDLGTILLGTGTKVLKEVTVQGQRALIEERVDRTVYNAENDATSRGGDATDVLKKVPLLSVDLDGNVTLRGSQNIRVLINNKPSTIAASSVADALKQIPAEQIKSVEVITSPSAKYDAEGSGGIINIITKKNTMQGATLNINSSAGIRGSNLGLNGNYRKGKLGLSLGGWGRANYNVHGAFENAQITYDTAGDIHENIQQAETRNQGVFGNYTLGLDYDINKYNLINASVRFGVRNGNNYQDRLSTQAFVNDQFESSSLRNAKTTDNSANVDINVGYTHLYEKPQREFSILGLYGRNNRINNFTNYILNESDFTTTQRIRNDNQSYNEESTLQMDYATPIGSTQLIEIGGKEIFRRVSSDYKYFIAQGSDGAYVPNEDASLANIFYYNQNVASGYVAYTYNTQKAYSFKTGLRYEYTTISANFANEQDISIPAYGVLVPSVNVSRKLKNGNLLKVAYNRRIQRPSIQFLNPNLQASNPLNTTIGNPNLSPEYSNNYELSYSTFIKGTTLNFSAFARNTNNAIQSVRDLIGKDTIRTTYQNIGEENAYGMNIFANINIGSKFSLNGGTDFYYATLTNNNPNPIYNASNEGWVISGRIFANYTIKNGWGLQLFSFYRGRQVQLQGSQSGFGIYSLSVKKDFKNKKGSIGFGAENFMSPVFKIRTELKSSIIDQNSLTKLYNTNIKVNFSYTIGKMSFENQSRRRRSISNDDIKDGGGDNQNIDQPAGGQGQGGNREGGRTQAPQQQKPK